MPVSLDGMAWHGMAWYDPGYAMCKETQEGEGAAFGWYLDEWCEGDMGVQVCVRALLDFFFFACACARVVWCGAARWHILLMGIIGITDPMKVKIQ